MKKILLFFILLISLTGFGQYPVKQTMGSDSTIVRPKGALQSRLINIVFTDTAQANTQRIKFYDGSQIITITGGNKFWIRDSTLNKWIQVGEGSFNTSIGSGFKVAVDGTNNVKSFSGVNGLTTDSSISGTVRVRLGGPFTGVTTLTGTGTSSPANTFNINAVRFKVDYLPGSGIPAIDVNSQYIDIGDGPVNYSYTRWVDGFIYNRSKDSIQLAVGDTISGSSATSYLNMYPFSQDQFAPDRLAWRTTDSTGRTIIERGLVDIYGGSSWARISNSAGISLFPYLSKVRIDSLPHALTATAKMVTWDSVNQVLETRAIPGGGSGGIDDVLALNQTLTGPRVITTNGNTVSIIGGEFQVKSSSYPSGYFGTQPYGGDGGIAYMGDYHNSDGGTSIIVHDPLRYVYIKADSVNFKNSPVFGNSNKYNVQTGTSYTLLSTDNGLIVTLNNASAITLTIPAGLPAGFNCTIGQIGAGQVTITGSGTTINNRQSFTKTKGQYSMATIVQYGTNLFITQGDME